MLFLAENKIKFDMKAVIIIETALTLVALTSCGTSKDGNNDSLGGKVEQVFNETKTSMENAGHKFGDAIGFEDRLNPESDYIRISGYNYMPLYSVNIYSGSDANNFRNECRRQFVSRYKSAVVQSVAIPQIDWVSEPVKKDGKITGYIQTIFCYVIARDGSDGYINAKFVFQRYKNVGETFQDLKDKWPKWEKTDVMTSKIYNKLLSK